MATRGKKKDRDVTRTVTRKTFIRQLRRLADHLEGGERFTVTVGKERVALPREVQFSIEHEREGGADEELEFQVRWRGR